MERTREDLYQVFKNAVTTPSSEAPFFDEGDLVDIFDYAGDKNDDAVRTEVIAMSSRLYPDSEPLKVRKALYYYYIEHEDMARALLESEHYQHPMWDILALRLNQPEGDELINLLDEMLVTYPRMDDETLIQLVDAANSLDHLSWVLDHLEQLKTKTDYTPTLLYEVAVMASMSGENDTVIKLLDELTSIEPFYAPYWIMLARAYGEKDQYNDALNAIDYALAIDGDLMEALAVKTQLLLLRDMDVSEILTQMRSKTAADPTNTMLVRTLALAEQSALGTDQAIKVYEHYLELNPVSRELMQSYLEMAKKPKSEIIDRFISLCDLLNEDDVIQMAQSLAFDANFNSMAMLLEAYHNREQLTTGFEMLVTALYLNGEYGKIEQMFAKPTSNVYNPRFSSMVSLIYAFSLVRLRHKAKAKTFITEWIEANSKAIFAAPGERVRNTGVRYYMHTLLDNLATLTPAELKSLDPILPISSDSPPTF